MKVICTRNTSKSLPYMEGFIYTAVEIPGGMYEIRDGAGSAIIAPLNGHYLTFEPLKD